MLRDKKIFFLDCDGTLALSNNIFAETKGFLAALKAKNKIIYVLTNNSSKTPRQHLEKFNKLALDLSEDNVLVSSTAALEYLKQQGYKHIFWLANEPVSDYIKSLGFVYTEEIPQALLLTYDNQLTYNKLEKFIYLLRQGIPYFATHCDIVCPDPNGYLPDIGTFIKLIEMTTTKLPQLIFGKPNKEFIKPILDKHGLTYNDAVIIGDRLYTDMALAQDSAITSVLVLTGETSLADYQKSQIKCDLVADNLAKVQEYL